MWRFSLNVEFGKDEPPPEFSQTDAMTSLGPPPEQQPIGFCPPADPTRHQDPEDA